MKDLSQPILIKLLIPIAYLLLTFAYFAYSMLHQVVLIHHWIGLIITIPAFILWIVSRIQLGNAFTLAPKAKFLVQSGIYRKLRHPVYYFSIVAITGITIFTWSILMLIPLILLVIVEVIRIKQEEKVLLQRFGDEYVQYKNSTWF